LGIELIFSQTILMFGREVSIVYQKCLLNLKIEFGFYQTFHHLMELINYLSLIYWFL